MGKTTFKPTPDLSQKLLAAFGFADMDVAPANTFNNKAGVPKDPRKEPTPELSALKHE